jgi:asparagine synthase (glutamine-hydrolysing)
VRTFTIGFQEEAYDEARHARAVAAHLGTDHADLIVTPDVARRVIPRLAEMFDEPFADSSQIPTYLVSELTRRGVTVSLSGDGGDELFAGYPRYTAAARIWDRVGWLPPGVRRGLGRGLSTLSPAFYNRRLGRLAPHMGQFGATGPAGDKLHKLAHLLTMPSTDSLYQHLVSHWKTPTDIVIGSHEPPTPLGNPCCAPGLPNFIERMMYLDTVTYLPGDILTKVDRASMAVSLEARLPLLDHRIVEFAWRLPLALKLRDGQAKWALRQVLYQYVPPALIERPKMGFGVPLDEWLRGPLREWAEDLLAEDRLRRDGFFHPAPIRRTWAEHLSGQRNWQYCLWGVLMFQTWYARWGG